MGGRPRAASRCAPVDSRTSDAGFSSSARSCWRPWWASRSRPSTDPRPRRRRSRPTRKRRGIPSARSTPPSASAMPGYVQSYVSDFPSNTLPSGWSVFTGAPNGDPGGQWGASHVVVGDGLLQLNTWRDPAYGNEWVAGGLCQCTQAQTYGAYFVRSRMTGPGPTLVLILWPAVGWPPEIDFTETYGETTDNMATLHFTAANEMIHSTITIDMTQWHTWGVVWTPNSVTYTVDGRVWGSVKIPADIASQAMTLHIQQQTWCSQNRACPTSPQSTLVDWVSEYTASTRQTVKIGSFAKGRATLTPTIRSQVNNLALDIQAKQVTQVAVVGYGEPSPVPGRSVAVGLARARTVVSQLRRQLANLGAPNVAYSTTARPSSSPRASHSVIVNIL